MGTKPDDGCIAKQKGKRRRRRRENMWQYSHHSLLLFPHQLLVVIVYSFGRRLALPLLFLTVCFRDGVDRLLRPNIYSSITDIVLPFSSSLLLHTMKIDTRNWK